MIPTQLVLSYFARPGDVARTTCPTTCSHRYQDHVIVRLRPDWHDLPAYKGTDRIAWEWVMPEPAFSLSQGEQVLVLGKVRWIIDAPPGYGPEPWETPLLCVQGLQHRKVGWGKAWDFKVPLL